MVRVYTNLEIDLSKFKLDCKCKLAVSFLGLELLRDLISFRTETHHNFDSVLVMEVFNHECWK